MPSRALTRPPRAWLTAGLLAAVSLLLARPGAAQTEDCLAATRAGYLVLDFVESYPSPSPLRGCATRVAFSRLPIEVRACRDQSLLTAIRTSQSLRWLLDKRVIMVVAAEGATLEHIVGGFEFPERRARGATMTTPMCARVKKYDPWLSGLLRASIALYELGDARNVCAQPKELDELFTKAIEELSPNQEPEATLRGYLTDRRQVHRDRVQKNDCGPNQRNVILLQQRPGEAG